MTEFNEKTGRPWRFPSAYDRDPDVQMSVRRWATVTLTESTVSAVARAALRATPWAGRPKPFDELTESHQAELLEHARWALEHPGDLAHLHDDICCREHGTHAMPHRGCILR